MEWFRHLRHHHFVKNNLLLLSLLLLMTVLPFAKNDLFWKALLFGLDMLCFFLILNVFSPHKIVFRFTIVLIFIPGVIGSLDLITSTEIIQSLKMLSISFLFVIFSSILFYYLMTTKKLSAADISNVISIYLMTGMAFGFLYASISILHPESFSINLYDGKSGTFDFIYYSFIGMTSTGFGDILPLTKFTRLLSLFESIFGVLYIAVIIGRMVGMGMSASENK